MKKQKRSVVRRLIKQIGKEAELRVVGNEKEGFRMALKTPQCVVPFGHCRPKQSEIVGLGERLFGMKPKKLLAK